ncbi:ras-domain-containing protein [Schizopora paradoxa]|uniref:Ras-domain-containing protein n=1 Tax=Schizopora paradoxa TaxID=27342 RepID=A0A0H2SHM5_9AGAM|nr:ras-domain-containing protein [Schizopora paradoxa]
MSAQNPIRRKLVIVGDGACGKTSLLSTFAMGEFPKEYEPTIFENYVAEIQLDGKHVQLALWDTAGQEEYERLRPLSYSRAHVILIAFAIDTPDSLDNVQWIEEVRSICGPDIPVILVGCKQDLRPQPNSPEYENYVHTARGEKIARDIGARSYKECSALRLEGVDDVFEAATRASMLMRSPNGVQAHARRRSSVSGFDDEKGKSKWGCCIVC